MQYLYPVYRLHDCKIQCLMYIYGIDRLCNLNGPWPKVCCTHCNCARDEYITGYEYFVCSFCLHIHQANSDEKIQSCKVAGFCTASLNFENFCHIFGLYDCEIGCLFDCHTVWPMAINHVAISHKVLLYFLFLLWAGTHSETSLPC